MNVIQGSDSGSMSAPGIDWKRLDPTGTKRRSNKSIKVVAIVLFFIAGFGFLLFKGLGNALQYFYTAQQAVQMRATLGSSTFRLEGVVVPGTIKTNATGVDFSVRFASAVVPVVEVGVPPQLFQPNVPVVVVGHFAGQVFKSDQIMIKHSSNYVAAHPNRIKNAGGGS